VKLKPAPPTQRRPGRCSAVPQSPSSGAGSAATRWARGRTSTTIEQRSALRLGKPVSKRKARFRARNWPVSSGQRMWAPTSRGDFYAENAPIGSISHPCRHKPQVYRGLSWSDPRKLRPAQAVPLATVRGAFGDPMAQILVQVRRGKQRHVASVDGGSAVSTTGDAGWRGPAVRRSSHLPGRGSRRVACRSCGSVSAHGWRGWATIRTTPSGLRSS